MILNNKTLYLTGTAGSQEMLLIRIATSYKFADADWDITIFQRRLQEEPCSF